MDDIHPNLLFELASELCGQVTRLFELSLRSYSFPTDWKDTIGQQASPCRLLELGMFSRRFRCHRGDLFSTYRILTGKVGPDLSGLLQPARLPSLRGHTMNLHKLRSDGVRADFRLSRRVVDSRNTAPENLVSAPTVKEFEHRLDAFRPSDFNFPFSS
ncbi:unnamed protein product [Dicrocoelium dendriticum]|nr:unnamed protein product [Dicrocoelium dendriticum]